MDDGRSALDVGRIVKAHGLKGQVLVDLWSDRTERLAVGSVLFSERGDLTVVTSAPHQARHLVRFDRITTREEADSWRGALLSAPRIEDPSVIWIDDLFGAELVDQTGQRRGTVVEIEANPASDLMVLDSGALVPLTFVVSVRANERIEIVAPEGLFE
ncbi:MAG TPA: hypothetical protein VGG21_03755 [Acidimicrobiales bacterium]